MSGFERKLVFQTAAIGGVLTVLVFALHLSGWVQPMEHWLYHQRARVFQYFTPAPSEQVIHLDIDDPSLEEVGRWPWDRADLAAILDEVTEAGAKAIGLDILLLEPTEPRLLRDGNAVTEVDDDQLFADAVSRSGRVLVPVSLKPTPGSNAGELEMAARDVLFKDLEAGLEDVRAELDRLGLDPDRAGSALSDIYIRARKWAVYERIDGVLGGVGEDISLKEVSERLLPNKDRQVNTAASRLVERTFDRVKAMRELRRFTKPESQFVGRALPVGEGEDKPPITKFGKAAAVTGYVDYLPYADGVVRGIPLFQAHRGRLYPHFSLALLCQYLDVDVRSVKLGADTVTIERPDGGDPIVIPVHSHYNDASGERFDGFIDVPWWGPSDEQDPNSWRLMYDFPAYERTAQHMPLSYFWSIVQDRRRVETNSRAADEKLLFWYAQYEENIERMREYEASIPPLSDWAARVDRVKAIVEDDFVIAVINELRKMQTDGEELPELHRLFIENFDQLILVNKAMPGLLSQIEMRRTDLRKDIEGKAVIWGWTASAASADFVPTSLHAKCPGPIIHGALFSGMLTGNMWQEAPGWLAPALTLMLGVLTTGVSTMFSPGRGAIAAVVIGGGWIMLNGLVMFDYGNMIVDLGAPLLGVLVVWVGCTIWRWIAERAERARITARFRSYVDPALVNYVIEHPEQGHLNGEERELTVVFTDLAGFTTISEVLKERTVPLLNRYMGLMVPLIREHNGYVNKFLGDGIMFFYGAPRGNAYHAADSVSTVLKMQKALVQFNKELKEQDLPTVQMRAGIVSGKMVVGDAGPPDASDYTVLGDAVNLSARLESANKQTGSLTLINHRTAQLLNDLYLLRPIARLQVKGKSQSVMTYEPICYLEDATPDQKKLVEMSEAMVDEYITGRFAECLERVADLEDAFGINKTTDMYRKACEKMIIEPDSEFSGQMVLTEK